MNILKHTFIFKYLNISHQFHLVDLSPWPLVASLKEFSTSFGKGFNLDDNPSTSRFEKLPNLEVLRVVFLAVQYVIPLFSIGFDNDIGRFWDQPELINLNIAVVTDRLKNINVYNTLLDKLWIQTFFSDFLSVLKGTMVNYNKKSFLSFIIILFGLLSVVQKISNLIILDFFRFNSYLNNFLLQPMVQWHLDQI